MLRIAACNIGKNEFSDLFSNFATRQALSTITFILVTSKNILICANQSFLSVSLES